MVDVDLRTRLVRSEAEASRRLAISMRELGNDEATAHDVACGVAVSLGSGRYVNRVLCTSASLDDADLDEVVAFFTSRRLPPSIQIVDELDPADEAMLGARGFERDWQRVVMAAPARAAQRVLSGLRLSITSVGPEHLAEWLDVLARGNGATSPSARTLSNEHGRAAHGIDESIDLMAHIDGTAAACGTLQRVDRVGWLGGAATVPEYRRRGLQRALLDRRIDLADLDAYDHVAATAVPDSTSSRNLERAGLSLVARQTVWTSRSSARHFVSDTD